VDDDLLTEQTHSSLLRAALGFWRGAVGAVLGLSVVVMWAWKGLAWALLALICMLLGAIIARYSSPIE